MSLFKSHKNKTVNFITLWDEIASAVLRKNDSNFPETRPYNLYADTTGLYSGEHNITFLYTIDGYPAELENSFRSSIRNCCLGTTRVSFIMPLEQTSIDWNGAQMKSRMRTWRALDDGGEGVDEYNLYQNLNSLDNKEWKRDSLVYLSTAELRRGRKMFKCRSLMMIQGERGIEFDRSVKAIVEFARKAQLKLSRITGDIPEYLKAFSPFCNTANPDVYKQCGSITITDELLSRFNTYQQGKIGKSGIYWGTDIFSAFPCLKPVKKTSEDAENWLITAETGGGKSFFVKGLVYQLLALDQYNGTINDIEGFEYLPIANYMSEYDKVTVVNMGEGTGAYFDPVEIILTGDLELDKDMYSLSVSFTLALFKCLLANKEENEWVDIVINDAVSRAYAKNGVNPVEMETWGNSKGLTLYDVYNELKNLKVNTGSVDSLTTTVGVTSAFSEKLGRDTDLQVNDVFRLVTTNTQYQSAIETCLAKISRYFEPNGVKASLFRNRINISDIKDAKLVICSFGMAGKAESMIDPIQMSLIQLYAANISHLRSIFSKHAGKFNFKLWEEFQRWGKFPDADKTINVALTGGRKLGDINIIVTNKVGEMLEDDRFGVFSNITSIAIGCIWDAEVRENLCARLSINSLLPDLNLLVENNKDIDVYVDGDTLRTNPFAKGFLIGLDKTIYTLARMTIPEGLAQSKLFRTGIDVKKKGESNDIH